MPEFRVFRAGLRRRELLKVTLDDDSLKISGHAPLVLSLTREGVTDFTNQKHHKIQTNLKSENASAIFNVLKRRFLRSSAYEVHEVSPKPLV